MKKSLIGWTERIVSGISCLGAVWILASWADVICHNLTDCVYASWNLFTILF